MCRTNKSGHNNVTHPHARVHAGPDDFAFRAALLHEPVAVAALSVGDTHLYERTLYFDDAAIDSGRCNLRNKTKTSCYDVSLSFVLNLHTWGCLYKILLKLLGHLCCTKITFDSWFWWNKKGSPKISLDKKVYEKAEFLMRIGPLLLNINDMAHHVDAPHGLAKSSCAECRFFRDLEREWVNLFSPIWHYRETCQGQRERNTSDPLTLLVAGLSTVTEPSLLTPTRFASRTVCPRAHWGREDTAGRNLYNLRNHLFTNLWKKLVEREEPASAKFDNKS